jgi:aldose 1-epimerase
MDVAPETGGAVRQLIWKGLPVLAADPDRTDPVLGMGCFAMVPFANRIRHGRLPGPGGRQLEIKAAGVADPVHPIHGVGWLRTWTVDEVDEAEGRVRLFLDHAGDVYWPWAFQAWLGWSLTEAAFCATLVVSMEEVPSGQPSMPASIGLHPWFPMQNSRFTAPGTRLWAGDADSICSQPVEHAGFDDAAASSLDLDHCLTGWDGEARIALQGHRFLLFATTPEGAASRRPAALHVYAPSGGTRFCLEPMSARSGAFDAEDPVGQGVAMLAPGRHDLVMSMGLVALD